MADSNLYGVQAVENNALAAFSITSSVTVIEAVINSIVYLYEE